MKKVVALIGSRQKKGNTATFVKTILNKLPKDEFEIEYLFPQEFQLSHCTGCHTCFKKAKCVVKDDLEILQEKILSSDIFVISSPVYLHYMTADLKLILDRCSWWAHTLRLQGKPVVVLSTCNSNGHKSVIEPLSKIMNWMGGNVIATCNGSQFPNQLENELWLEEVSTEIQKRMIAFSKLVPQSNEFLEATFSAIKQSMLEQKELIQEFGIKSGELEYWQETGMLECNTFKEYLSSRVFSQGGV
ncbi:NADPH-dependent FMN reductase [Pilibacter termitis]|uniref:NADPH-dependent FMN reductase n=1 Tax=Pilibacter termitis TaxID=263852 RepID=A0A1T4KFY6_9ENTE|nr:flavodoxin family protein [Pilibacter termitis]SJZ41329.1 NADPH-dependent FMN reductase [Pilibacter termitis]